MNDSGYVVAFNILDFPDRQWWWSGSGLVLAFLVYLVILIFWIIEDQKLGKIAFFKLKVGFLVVFVLLISIVLPSSFIATFRNYQKCANALESGKASYVEGTVENFVPMPYYGHTPGIESFTVSGVPFSYSDWIPEPGFNQTSSHGGPIRQGLTVRIWYVRNRDDIWHVRNGNGTVDNPIVKLEIKK